MTEIINANKPLKDKYKVPGDKSISHRAAILASLTAGITKVKGYSTGKDCIATLNCLKMLGVKIDWSGNEDDILTIEGKSMYFDEPFDVLNAQNSGTTTRLLLGVLSGQRFFSCITGDESLRSRPMKRVVDPLTVMGADFYGRDNSNKLPICCVGKVRRTTETKFHLPVASAQVKSAILLAGLYEKDDIEIIEPAPTRDHTERMLRSMGVEITKIQMSEEEENLEDTVERSVSNKILLKQPSQLKTDYKIEIPGDFSSAAFLIAAAVLKEKSKITVKDVGINPSRTGFLQLLDKMGAGVILKNERSSLNEPIADIEVEYVPALKACTVEGQLVPNVIDELPLFAVLATQADGVTRLNDAKELRYKETDRIKAISSQLRKMGADITEKDDGFIVRGPTKLKGSRVESFDDHRIAMALTVASKIAEEDSYIENPACADISFPGFYNHFR